MQLRRSRFLSFASTTHQENVLQLIVVYLTPTPRIEKKGPSTVEVSSMG